jgi:hypothetical protein
MSNSQNQSEISDRLFLLVIFTVLGMVLGFGIAHGVSSLATKGVFSFWKPLTSGVIVPEKILYANSNMVWVQTDRGEMYFHQINCPISSTECGTWRPEENRNRFDNYEKPPNGNEECAAHVFIRPNAPPRNSIQCVYASRVHTLNDGFTYYALSSDQKIWYWRTPNSGQKSILVLMFILIGPLAGFFFGWNLTARRKGRYKEVLADLGYLFTSMFLFAIAGFILGIVAGIGFLHYQNTGAFTKWQLLESPVKFTHIVNGNTGTVWAQSADGTLYVRNLNCTWEKCDFWTETDAVPEDALSPNEGVSIRNICNFESGDVIEGSVKPKKQPGNVVECVLARGAMYETSWIVYYALLDDGTIWNWKYTSDMYALLYTILISVFVGVVLGILACLVAFIIKITRRKRLTPSASR